MISFDAHWSDLVNTILHKIFIRPKLQDYESFRSLMAVLSVIAKFSEWIWKPEQLDITIQIFYSV